MIMGKCKNKHYLALYHFIKWSVVSCMIWVCLKYGVLNSIDWANNLILYVDLFFNILFSIIMLVLIGLLLFRLFNGLNKKNIIGANSSSNAKKNITLICNFFLILGICFTLMSFLPSLINNIQSDNNVHVDILESEYSNTASVTFQTYNEGFLSARNVKVKISVIEDSGNYGTNHNKLVTGDVLASKIFYVGSISPGKPVINTVKLDVLNHPENIVFSVCVV